MITDSDLSDFLSQAGKDDWGSWSRDPDLPNDQAWRNAKWRVLAMPSGDWTHVAIWPIDGGEPLWRDKQRIKNELFGENAVAIEIMPAQRDVVAAADCFHVWLAPRAALLPSLV